VIVRAIILAAGTNSRISSYAHDVPKCLLRIDASTILERQIGFLTKSGLKKEDIFVVSGHMNEKIAMIHSSLLLNRNYRITDNAYSLYIALEFLHKLPQVRSEDEVLVLDGDLVYDRGLISKVVKDDCRNILVTRKEHLLNGSKEEVVLVDDTGRINNICRFSDVNNKNSGTMKFKKQLVYTGILKMSDSTARKFNQLLGEKKCWTYWYTMTLARLLDTVTFFSFLLPASSFCFDIDTSEDYEKVCKMLREK
jgi:choline kinase